MGSTALNTIGEMEGDGASFKLNGQPADASDLMVALNGLDQSDLESLNSLLQSIQQEMGFRRLPFQYIPSGEGYAPTVDLLIPGRRGRPWDAGATWNRKRSHR